MTAAEGRRVLRVVASPAGRRLQTANYSRKAWPRRAEHARSLRRSTPPAALGHDSFTSQSAFVLPPGALRIVNRPDHCRETGERRASSAEGPFTCCLDASILPVSPLSKRRTQRTAAIPVTHSVSH